jgi:hypothetical protein
VLTDKEECVHSKRAHRKQVLMGTLYSSLYFCGYINLTQNFQTLKWLKRIGVLVHHSLACLLAMVPSTTARIAGPASLPITTRIDSDICIDASVQSSHNCKTICPVRWGQAMHRTWLFAQTTIWWYKSSVASAVQAREQPDVCI